MKRALRLLLSITVLVAAFSFQVYAWEAVDTDDDGEIDKILYSFITTDRISEEVIEFMET